MWRDILKYERTRKERVKKLVWKLYFGKINLCFEQWKNFSNKLDNQVRLTMLSHEYTVKQVKLSLFAHFRHLVTEQKHKKYNRKFYFFKLWRDYIRYKKHLMRANIATFHF